MTLHELATEAADLATDGSESGDQPLLVDLRQRELTSVLTDRRATVLVTGEIDIASAPNLHERLLEALGKSVEHLLVDLRAVSFIDSTGLGVLVNARQRARALGIEFELLLPEGSARFPFEVTGLASMFETSSKQA